MGKRPYPYFIFIILILLVVISVIIFMTKGISREKIKSYPATIIVNEKILDEKGSIYWYGKAHNGSARAQYPFLSVLESLGCILEEKETRDSIIISIGVEKREYELAVNGYYSSLYENGVLVVPDVARRERYNDGSLYLDVEKTEDVMTALGFDRVSYVIDDDEMVIRLSVGR